MAKVYTFPIKKELPDEMKDTLGMLAKTYVKLLNTAFKELTSEMPSDQELDEIKDMIIIEYACALEKAMNDLEEP